MNRLAAEHPEHYRGGVVDQSRPIGGIVSGDDAWERAARCVEVAPARAAYWAGFARASEADA